MQCDTEMGKGVIGVDLGGTNLRAGRVNGNTLEKIIETPISAQSNEKVVCDELIAAIRSVFSPDSCGGIGVAVPSVVDPVRGIVYSVENIPSWLEVPLKDILETEFAVPVTINNDANAFILGEFYFGAGIGYRHIVGLTVGTALGAGIIIDGRLYNGINCGAGEIGCLPYLDRTLEYYCSGSGIERKWGKTGKELCALADQGDISALNIFHQFGLMMGDAVAIAMLAYDPELIVIGGSVSHAFAHFKSGMMDGLSAFPYQQSLEKIKIVPTCDTRIPVLGAAALHLDSMRKEPSLSSDQTSYHEAKTQ